MEVLSGNGKPTTNFWIFASSYELRLCGALVNIYKLWSQNLSLHKAAWQVLKLFLLSNLDLGTQLPPKDSTLKLVYILQSLSYSHLQTYELVYWTAMQLYSLSNVEPPRFENTWPEQSCKPIFSV